jgi:hypothetical protein
LILKRKSGKKHLYSVFLMVIAFFFAYPKFSYPESTIGIGQEFYDWKEFWLAPDTQTAFLYGNPMHLEESGRRDLLTFSYLQDGGEGWLFGYGLKLRVGTVTYNGYNQSVTNSGGVVYTPLANTSTYYGADNGISLRYHQFNKNTFGQFLDYIGTLGLDMWVRDIGSQSLTSGYMENYAIGYAKLGLGLGDSSAYGGYFEFGGKYPFATWEKAYLQSAGVMTTDTVIHPGSNVSYYASFAYRFRGPWSINFTYDSYRFTASEWVTAYAAGCTPSSTDNCIHHVSQPESWQDIFMVTVGYTIGLNNREISEN